MQTKATRQLKQTKKTQWTEQIFLSKYEKKNQNLPNKSIQSMIAQVNHSQIATVLTNYNPLTKIIFAEDHQIDEIHIMIHIRYSRSNSRNYQ